MIGNSISAEANGKRGKIGESIIYSPASNADDSPIKTSSWLIVPPGEPAIQLLQGQLAIQILVRFAIESQAARAPELQTSERSNCTLIFRGSQQQP